MKKLDYIFIDLDGPILDGKLRNYNCYRDIIKDAGKPLDIVTYWMMKRNMVKQDVILEKSMYGGSYEEFYTQWFNNIEAEFYLDFDILKPNVNEVLLEWKKYVKCIVLITLRKNRDNLIWQLNKLNIIDLFDEIISCESMGSDSKYNALMHFQYQHAIFIGDTEEDMNTAKKLNILSIGIINGLREKQYLDSNIYVPEIKDICLNDIISLVFS